MSANQSGSTTIQLGLINTTLRIAMDCGALNLWFEPDPSGVGVSWQGRPAWDFADMKSRIGLQYDVITDLPKPRDNLYSDMLALIDGVADISIDYWGVNYKRSKLIDFSFPNSYSGDYIFSGYSQDFIHADLVMGIFDSISYGCLFFALAMMTIVLWQINSLEQSEQSFMACLLFMVGNVVNQPLNPTVVPKSLLGRTIISLFSLYNYVICLMYGSIVISVLVRGSQPPGINSLEDLNKTENIDIRIIMKEGYTPEFLKSANMLDGFNDRIDYVNTYNDQNKTIDVLKLVLQRSHVFIASGIHHDLCNANKDANITIANLEDFRYSRLDSLL